MWILELELKIGSDIITIIASLCKGLILARESVNNTKIVEKAAGTQKGVMSIEYKILMCKPCLKGFISMYLQPLEHGEPWRISCYLSSGHFESAE